MHLEGILSEINHKEKDRYCMSNLKKYNKPVNKIKKKTHRPREQAGGWLPMGSGSRGGLGVGESEVHTMGFKISSRIDSAT